MITKITQFLFLLACLSTTCFANQLVGSDDCIKEIIGNRVYLNPTTILIDDKGIFINSNGNFYCVNIIEMDNHGVYIDTFKSGPGDVFVGECPICHDVTVFGVCMNGACPSKQ